MQSQNYNEILPHAHQDAHSQKKKKKNQLVLVRMWLNRNPHVPLLGTLNSTAAMENSMAVSQKN